MSRITLGLALTFLVGTFEPVFAAASLKDLASEAEQLLDQEVLLSQKADRLTELAGQIEGAREPELRAAGLHRADWASLKADLWLRLGQRSKAIAAYREATSYGNAQRLTRGLLFEGKLYLPEIYRCETFGLRETNYLLALDPATGRVLERHFLPGLPRRLRQEAQGLRVEYSFPVDESTNQGWLRILGGKLDRPVGVPYGTNPLQRLVSMRAGWLQAVNFIYRKPDVSYQEYAPSVSFKLREDPVPDAPASLEDLERNLKAAIQNDPTQPWNFFFLGQAAWAKKSFAAASAHWEDLFGGNFPATPYYEYFWMAAFYEKFGQPDWADKAFREGSRQLKSLQLPSLTSSEFFFLFNFPLARREYVQSERLSLERQYLWLQRIRSVSVTPLDDFRARAWAEYFEAQGEQQQAEVEWEYLKNLPPDPFFTEQNYAYLDYAFWALVATFAGWTTLLMAIWRARPAKTWRPAVKPLLLASLVLLAAFFGLGLGVSYLAQTIRFEMHPSDGSLIESSAGTLSEALRSQPLVEAVARHLAGDLEHAKDLYRAMPGDLRAKENLDALELGRLPPHRPRFEDALKVEWAGLLPSWWQLELWKPGVLLRFHSIASISRYTHQALLAPAGLLLLLLALTPASNPKQSRVGRARGYCEKILTFLVPGFFYLRRGHYLRGYLVATLLVWGASPLVFIATGSDLVAPGPPGPLSLALCLGPTWGNALLPLSAQIDPEHTLRYFRWTFFWTFAHIKVFLALVTLPLVLLLIDHLRMTPQILAYWRAAEPSPGPSA